MKNLLLIILFIIIILPGLKCTKGVSDLPDDQTDLKEVITKANKSCQSANPDQSLQWLKDIIVKAEEDKETKKHMGNYMGKIFSTSYQNQPVFYISMALGSGGVAFYLFDCNGITVRISPSDDVVIFSQNAKKDILIYSNVPI